MAIFGLGDDSATAVKDKKTSKKEASSAKKTKKDDTATDSQEDEAKALLAKMEAKKDADECPFC